MSILLSIVTATVIIMLIFLIVLSTFSQIILFKFTDDQSKIDELYFETSMFPELASNPRYSNLKLFQCNNLNNQIDFILLESDAIKFDKLIYSAKNKCQNNKPIDCLREFVDFADVSNNNELSRAELTRFAKFVVKWLTLKGGAPIK